MKTIATIHISDDLDETISIVSKKTIEELADMLGVRNKEDAYICVNSDGELAAMKVPLSDHPANEILFLFRYEKNFHK
jgi:hypothetical protein